MTPTKQNKSQAEWEKLSAEFQHKSDRTTAILGAAYLETNLGQLISYFFVPSAIETGILLADSGPLCSFGSRLKAAYGMGLISKNEYHDLNLIYEMRNIFVSDGEVVSFSDNGVREKCFRLKIPRDMLLPGETRTPRHLFVFTSTILSQHLALRTQMAENERRKTPDEFILVETE
jgi:DNA-binding MltR family transcriptional regulator